MRSTQFAMLLGVLAAGASLALPGVAGAQAPRQDSAVGSGDTVSSFTNFSFDATSDPSGGSPSGTASWNQFTVFHFEGTVSCLNVNGNRAVIGVRVTQGTISFAGFYITAVDGGPAGSGLDTLDATPLSIVPTDCSQVPAPFSPDTVTRGDIVIRDVPPLPTTKDECKNGGWRDFGVFKNQGDCVSFVATGGKNPPAGP